MKKRQKFLHHSRLQKFIGALYGSLAKAGYEVTVAKVLWRVHWREHNLKQMCKEVFDEARRVGGEAEFDGLIKNLLSQDEMISGLTLASLLCLYPEKVGPYKMLLESHPDNRLRRAWRMFQNNNEKNGAVTPLTFSDFTVGYTPRVS